MSVYFINLIYGSIAALLISLISIPFIMKLAGKIGAMDQPNKRKIHETPIPRLGGLGIVVSFYVGIIIAFGLTTTTVSIIIPSLFIVYAGILDDVYSISPKVKLLLQLMGAIAFVLISKENTIQFFDIFGNKFVLENLSVVITIVWLVAASNAVNIIDGLDGLAGGVSLISAFFLGVVCLLTGRDMYAGICIILVLSIAGFLKYNFYPAKIFMGDTGSLFLGFIVGILGILGTVKEATIVTLAIPIMILGFPVLDTFWAILRRFIKGQPIFEADKSHVHHKLLRMGLSQRQTVLFIYGLSIFLGLGAIITLPMSSKHSVIVIFAMIVVVIFLLWRMGVFKRDPDIDAKDKNKKIEVENLEKKNMIVDNTEVKEVLIDKKDEE